MPRKSQTQTAVPADAVGALLAALGISPEILAAAVVPAETAEPEAKQSKQSKQTAVRTVKPENADQPPTSKQSYFLLMRARDCGLETFAMPTTRHGAEKLIGAVSAAKSKAAKVKLLAG